MKILKNFKNKTRLKLIQELKIYLKLKLYNTDKKKKDNV